jgi:hypothetical protein
MNPTASLSSRLGRLFLPFLGLMVAFAPVLAGEETVVPAKQSWRLSTLDEPPPAEILEVGSNESRSSVALLAFDLPEDVQLDPQAAVTLEMEVESSMPWGGVWVNLYDTASDPEARPVNREAPGEVPVGVIVPAPTKDKPRGPMSGKASLQLSSDAVDRLRSERKLVLVLHGSPVVFKQTMYRVFSEASDSPPVLRIAGGG